MSGGGGPTLEHTPTWVVSVVCAVIVAISLAVERILHYTGKLLIKKDQRPLNAALQKIKEELMLLGFISLLLTVFQTSIHKICISKHLAMRWQPCKAENEPVSTAHFQNTNLLSSSIIPGERRLLAGTSAEEGYCEKKGMAPFLSEVALHDLHVFIFVLAVVHVIFCALTILFGGARIRQWKGWEDSIPEDGYDPDKAQETKITQLSEHAFIKSRYLGVGKRSALLGWLHSFSKQFFGSLTKSDYTTLRLGFVMTHCRGNPRFDFHRYMMRALEADFKKVVGISWYLWIFAVVSLTLNVYGWHAYFWLAFIPVTLLLAVGTKLEHIIIQLAQEVAEKHAAVEGDLVVKPSNEHFWFNRPRLTLFLIHLILFQNSFQMSFFVGVWVQYGFGSCVMGEVGFIIPRVILMFLVQFLCSYSTLPLYAIVTQMGSSYKKAIFDEHIQQGLISWARQAKRNTRMRKAINVSEQGTEVSSPLPIQSDGVVVECAMEEGKAGEIESFTVSDGPGKHEYSRGLA